MTRAEKMSCVKKLAGRVVPQGHRRILAVVATRACGEPNRSSAWSVAGRVGGGRWYGPACPRVKGAARPCWTGLRPALDPRDPPALGQGSCGQGDGPARLTRPPPYVASAGRV